MSVKRNEYRNLTTGAVRTGSPSRGEILTDVEMYLLPVDAARNKALHHRGVADGMVVSATQGQTGLQIGPGTALDGNGRVLLLVDQGVAVTDPTIDPDAVQNVPTVPVDADGVPLETASTDPVDVAGDYLLTVSFHEVASTGTEANGPVRLHAPWLRLTPRSGFLDMGDEVVLAAVTLGTNGSVTSLTAGPRRAAGVRAGVVELRAPRTGAGPGLSVEQAGVAELRPRPTGGLDLRLTSDTGPALTAVSVDGGSGTVRLAAGLQLQGQAPGNRTYAMRAGPDGGWHLTDDSTSTERLAIDSMGQVTIGAATAERALHVEGSEVHSGGWAGGFSFADRTVAQFVGAPSAGERWVWYADAGRAYLWSGVNRLTVSLGGLDIPGMLFVSGREAIRSTDSWLRINESGASASGVHTPGLFAPGSLNVGGLDGWANPGDGNAWVRGLARIQGGGQLSGVVVGRSPSGVQYPWDYETVGVAAPNFNLRLQSPNAVIVHAGGAERLTVSADGADVRGRLYNTGREMLRGDDPWLRLNQAGQFTSGVHTPALFSAGSLNLGGVENWGNPGWGSAWLSGDLLVYGNVQLGANNGEVVIGGNQTGPFMQLHDDMWLGDPQDGTIQLLDATKTAPGRLRGIFLWQSTRADKSDIAPLGKDDLEQLLADALATEIVHYRWRGEDAKRPLRVGVVAEELPAYVAGDEGKSVSLAEYSTMLLGGLQVLAERVSALERRADG